jgi:hydrogenase-4 component F
VTDRELLALIAVALPAAIAAILVVAPRRFVQPLAVAGSMPVAGAGLTLAIWSLVRPNGAFAGKWVVVDATGGLFIAAIAAVGFASIAVSPAYLCTSKQSLFSEGRRVRIYYFVLYAFWAILFAIPLAGNLGGAWLLVEATTATSAILVGFSGKPRALEAAWKYLILTSLGLGVALLGIMLFAAGVPTGRLDALSWLELSRYAGTSQTAVVAYLLLLGGLAAKIGWAPVHNWLPDAHSEAPPPVSALLSGALLPAVLLVAWRSENALGPVVGLRTAEGVLIAFGLISLAIAVPFLWQSLAWKRLLAYSSLEHMGVIALGIGFGTPLALAGVFIHVLGHAVAKSLGFYASTPLLTLRPRAARHSVGGVGRTEPALGASMGISLATLSGLPPLPLFVSEILIVAGGFGAGRTWAAAIAIVLLALGFLGLAHALIETTWGRVQDKIGLKNVNLGSLKALSAVSLFLLLALAAAGPWLPESDLVAALIRGLR